jgi:hypothetical protein
VRFEEDGVGPEVRCSGVESGEDAGFCVGEGPLCLVAGVGVGVWYDDVNAMCFAECVGDVRAGVLVAWCAC